MLGMALALLAGLGFGATAAFARMGPQHMRATTGTLVSLMVGTALTLAIALSLHPSETLGRSRTALLWSFLAGLLNFPMGRLLNFTGVHLAGVSRASPIIGAKRLFVGVALVSAGRG